MKKINPESCAGLVLAERKNGWRAVWRGRRNLNGGLPTISFGEIPEELSWKMVRKTGESLCWNAIGKHGGYHFRMTPVSGEEFRMDFSAELKKPENCFRAVVFSVPELRAKHVLTQGLLMGGCESVHMPFSGKKDFNSYYQTVIAGENGFLRISTPLTFDHLCSLKGRPSGNKIRNLRMELSAGHFSGMKIEAPSVSFRIGESGFSLLEEYAEEQRSGTVDSGKDSPGWNSWDYYRWTITEDEVLANAERIAKDPVLSRHVKRIIVDDGWQYCYGEWEANSLFPSGMGALAVELRKMKFTPGLWFAPGIAEPHSRIAQLSGNMLALSEGGQPCLGFECMRRYGFLLDPTVPETRGFLKNLFRRYTEMGYGYFKLDFLAHVWDAPVMHDSSIPRAGLVAELVRPIREVTRGRALLLGCNYPFCSGTGLVDSVRIGGDIHATYSGIEYNTISVAARYWMNGKLWNADPDFALCRSMDTSDDPELTRLKCRHVFVEPDSPYAAIHDWNLVDIRRSQAEILLSIVLMNAGPVNLSDNLCRLNGEGLDLVRKVVSAEPGKPARPLDLFTSARPSCFLQEGAGRYRLLLINWTGRTEIRSVDLRKYGIKELYHPFNFWTGKKIRGKSANLSCELPAQSCLLIEFRKK